MTDALISAEENRRMFDQIAGRYDLLNALMSLGMHRTWRKRAVARLLAAQGTKYLDIGCGTGDIAIAVLRQAPGAHVTGIDLSEDMLTLAITKTEKARLSSRATYQTGDATTLAFPAVTFDGIISAFCLRNITDRATALREMRRVLRPNGSLVILELTPPRNPIMKVIHQIHTRGVVPLLGRLLSQGNAYRYLADSIAHFPQPARIDEELKQAGFVGTKWTPLTGGVVTLFEGRTP